MAFIFEQSDSEIYTSHAGLAVVGAIINRHSGLVKPPNAWTLFCTPR